MSDGTEQQSTPIGNDLDAAFAAFHEALSIAESIDAKDLIAQLHRSLAEAYELKGNLDQAYTHFKKYHEVERQVFNEESDKKLKNLQVVHQVEQTKRDAELQKTKADQLAELDKIKTRFFANLSHEFRTPLTLIIAPLQDQLDRPDKDILRPKAEVMLRSASRLLTLINELLDLSKLEEGKLKLRASEADIVFFLNGIFQSFESLAEQKGLAMHFETNVSELIGFFDRDKLEKIFSNLCSNAFKFTKEGSVGVRLEAESDAQRRLRIVIEDTGIGIPAEQQKNIFDRFYQIESSYARRYQGTGIGLALVKELVDLHHGTISLESTDGNGTRFTVELPTAREAYADDERVESVEELKKVVYVATEKKRVKKKDAKSKATKKAATHDVVLIVEDNPDVRAYIAEQLEAFQVVEAENGTLGIERAKEMIPDLIVSDVMMPEKSGYELCTELKSNLATNHIPIILLTAKGSIESKVKGLDIGADDYLTKPFNAKELKARVKNLIEQRKRVQSHYQGALQLPDVSRSDLEKENPFLAQATSVVEAHLGDESYSVEQFAYDVFLSRSQLHRKFVALTGGSPSDFIRAVRLRCAAERLRKGDKSVSQVAFEVGFGSNKSYFSKCFKEQFGKLPSEFSA